MTIIAVSKNQRCAASRTGDSAKMSRSSPTSRWCAVFLLLTSVSACYQTPPDHPVVGDLIWRGEHVEVWGTSNRRVCGGSFQAIDRYSELLARFADRYDVVSKAEPFRYYWYDEEQRDLIEELCTGSACSTGEAVYASGVPDLHEIVHSKWESIAGPGRPSKIAEGLATILGNAHFEVFFGVISPEHPALEELLVPGRTPGEWYAAAAYFTRLAVETDPYAGFSVFGSLGEDAGYEEIRSALTEAGMEFERIEQVYNSKPLRTRDSANLSIYECSLPLDAWENDGRVVLSGDLRCESPDALGPRNGQVWMLRTFEIPAAFADVLLEIRWVAVSGVLMGFSSCDEVLRFPRDSSFGEDSLVGFEQAGTRVTVLTPGKYWLRVSIDEFSGPSNPFELSIQPWSG